MIINDLFNNKKFVAKNTLNEFAPSDGGGDSGNYFQALASAWYNGTFDSGSLEKGIKSQQDVEQLLQRGVVCPDGVTRKFGIDYNSNFDGVVISSDDYYEHADHDETDSRTGKPFGPYDYMEFGDNDLDESAQWRDPQYKGQLYTQEKPDYNDTREYDRARWDPKPKGYQGRKEPIAGGEFPRTDPLVRGAGIGRTGIKHNINLSGKRKGLPSRDQITSLKQSIKDISGRHTRANLPEQGMAEDWKGDLGVQGYAVGGPIGGLVGGAVGELTKEQQLNEFAPLLAAGARLVIALAPKIAQVLKNTGKATAKAAAPVAKSGAEVAAKNAGQIGVGLGAYEIGSSVADIAKDITAKVGTALEEQTVMELAQVAFKFAIPAGIVLAILYGGKKVIDSLFSDSKTEQGVAEVSLGNYRKKATVNKAMAQTNKFFGRDDPAVVARADQTIAKREKGLGRADARSRPYNPPAQDAEKQQRDLTARYPNIDELVRRAEVNRDPNYEYADGQAYFDGREAEQHYQKLKQIQRVIQGLNESLNRSHLP